MALFMMEELSAKGCASPILYLEAWNWISKDISNLHRLSPFSGCRCSIMPEGKVSSRKNW